MLVLGLSFFVTAILYASVGFGGGSTYNAILVLVDTDYRILPVITLLCNLIVVTGGTWRFYRAGYIKFGRILPWVITSIPAAWVGGRIEISEVTFIGVLGFALLFSGVRMFIPILNKVQEDEDLAPIKNWQLISAGVGGILGFIAGLVGIGGGIFLAPILYFLRWDTAKSIAGMCSIFILLNSLAGLTGQIMKNDNAELLSSISPYWMLFPAVLIGGQIGSYLGAVHLDPKKVQLMTALLILYVSLHLLWRFAGSGM